MNNTLKRFALSRVKVPIVLLTAVVATAAQAGTIIWSGASGTDTNWSNPANWVGSVAPGSADDVKFFDLGSNGTPGLANNLDDSSFSGTIGSLQYGNTNGFHTTVIPNGTTLNITGGNGLTVGTLQDNGSAEIVTATVTGAGGALNLNNANAVIVVDQGRAANGNATQRATLDMSGLSTFTGNVSAIAVGSVIFGGANNIQNATGTLKLAQTNVITTFLPGSATNSTTSTPTNSIIIGNDNGNAGGVDFLFLGQSNELFTDSIGVGTDKATASMLFNTGLNSPVAVFRGTNGPTSRVRFLTIADMASSGGSSGNCSGTNDFTAGSVDMMVDTMSLARDRVGAHSGTSIVTGTFNFANGIVDANTVFVGNEQFGTVANLNPLQAVMNVEGTAVFRVNNVLYLGRTATNSTAGLKTTGTLNITNGTVYANNVLTGPFAVTNKINMVNGTLVVSNSLATNSTGLFTLSMTNSTLGLTVPANNTPRGLVQTLNTVGPANSILLDTTPVIFPVYPTNISLIHFTTWTGSNDFSISNPQAWAPGATIVSNGASQIVAISLPTDPRPVIAVAPTGYSGSPGDNVTTNFAVTVVDGSGAALTYQWFYYTNGATTTNLLSDGAGPSGLSTIVNTGTANMLMTNAQPTDNGNYFVVIANVYGAVTSAPVVLNISAGCSPPQIIGPTPQTVIQGNSATFSASVSANPAPFIQWQRGGVDVPGANSPTLIVPNVQYPADDQAVFSIYATNACGDFTNSATLTVIVPPVITNQPVSVVVTNTQSASFTVVAGGVPAPTYQWYKNTLANPIGGATSATLNFPAAGPGDTATYFVVVNNSAGSVQSSSVTLTVNSVMATTSMTPANASTGICYDTPLTVTFNSTPLLNTLGTIKIFNTANPSTPVDTLNMALGPLQSRTIAGTPFNSFPVIITGNTAAIYPHNGVMTSNQTYYVTIDDGVFTDSTGAYFSGIAASTWQFTTKPTGPVDPVNPVVAADGTADFVTVQGALDSVATNAPARRVIKINNGNYVEIVNDIKSNLTFRGQSRTGAVVGYANNNNNNPSTGGRMAFHVNAPAVAIENMTVVNTTPQGGSQAEAIMVDANGSQFILNNAEVDSRQDTILINSATSQAYFYNSLIQGNFDYVWGVGNLFVTNCEIRTIGGTGTPNLAAPRTANGNTGNWPGYLGNLVSNGFSFVECQLTRAAGVTNTLMSDHNGSTNGLVAYINCNIDLAGYTNADQTAQTSQLLWEFGCSNSDNTIALNNSASPFISFTQLTVLDPRLLAAESATNWLNGWVPVLAPNILANPLSQSIAGGGSATFSVSATGISDPTYQWLKNGTPLANQTNASLTISGASANDAAGYSVIVSNQVGTATSATATLTVGNTAPSLAPVANQTVNVGVTVNVTNIATDPDVPAQSLTFSLLAGPGTLNPATGVFTWRPPVASSGTSNGITVAVTDNGSPNLSATNSFAVFVNPVSSPVSSAASFSAGQFSMTVNGDTGPDYIIQVSSNLFDWQSLVTNSSPTMPFSFTDTNAAGTVQFYRILLGP